MNDIHMIIMFDWLDFSFFRTINPTIAAFVSFIDNVYKSWIGLCWSQLSVFHALQIFKFSRVSGIDDIFMGRFFLISNILFIFLLQIARFYFFGSMHESSEYQVYIQTVVESYSVTNEID